MFASQKYLGLLGGNLSLNVWTYLSECFLRIGKNAVAEKCFLKVLAELGPVIDEADTQPLSESQPEDPFVEILKT